MIHTGISRSLLCCLRKMSVIKRKRAIDLIRLLTDFIRRAKNESSIVFLYTIHTPGRIYHFKSIKEMEQLKVKVIDSVSRKYLHV